MNRVRSVAMGVAIVGLLVLAGCNQAKSPETVQQDVSKAQETGSQQVASAEQKEAKTDAQQDGKVASAIDSANAKTGDASIDTAVAQAEADNKVALSKCEALSGDQQKACRDSANAQLEQAKARAKAIKADIKSGQ
jgi:hypothetical protein